jgi:hypothetical protein
LSVLASSVPPDRFERVVEVSAMVIDCERCGVRGLACGDCVIGVLLGMPGSAPGASDGPAGGSADAAEDPDRRPSGASAVHLDAPEQRALAVLADQGLVPRLRLVSTPLRGVSRNGHKGENARDTG